MGIGSPVRRMDTASRCGEGVVMGFLGTCKCCHEERKGFLYHMLSRGWYFLCNTCAGVKE